MKCSATRRRGIAVAALGGDSARSTTEEAETMIARAGGKEKDGERSGKGGWMMVGGSSGGKGGTYSGE